MPSHLKTFIDTGQLRMISSGSSIPGKWIYACSQAYQLAYQQCHAVILKGQGHLETSPKFGVFYAKPHIHLGGLKSFLTRLALSQKYHHVPILGSRVAWVF